MDNNYQILHGVKTRCLEIVLHGGPQLLTRDPIAVANLFESS